jgi:thioredoxin-like negative regulator of GroEL
MSTASAAVPAEAASSSRPPRLVYFHSVRSGRCRRVEGFLAQVLQRRQNHDTFLLYRVDREEEPDLFARFRVDEIPTLVVVEGKQVRGRLDTPGSCQEIAEFLEPWLK